MKTGKKGIALIVQFEGIKLTPYVCPAGLWTVGIGTLIGNGKTLPPEWNRKFTLEECYALLNKELRSIERGISKYVTVPITQNQFDAIVSFVYNLGLGAFQRSTLRRKINRQDFVGAAKEFLRWNKANGKPLKGLTRRRLAESTLFLTVD